MSAIPFFVINLPSSTKRLANISGELQRIGMDFTLLPAVDASLLRDEEIAKVYDSAANRRMYFTALHKGEIACLLSHRLAWKKFLGTGTPFGVVLEDDAMLGERLPATIAALERRAIDWDLIKLYSYSTRTVERICSLTEDLELVRHRVVSLSAAAYCISAGGAHKLLAATQRIKRPTDVEFQFWWEHGLNVLAIEPSVAGVAKVLGKSTIGRHKKHGLTNRFARELGRPLFRARLGCRSARETRVLLMSKSEGV